MNTLTGSATGTTIIDQWNFPTLIKTEEVGESIEFIYKQSPMFAYTTFPSTQPPDRVFKIVFSCKDGKWNKSEPIYGQIVPATDEYYEFDE
jgi:hypothetical protein